MKFGRLLAILMVCAISLVYGHDVPREMQAALDAIPPDWLTVGEPIRASKSDQISVGDEEFRDPKGGAENTRTRVSIPSVGEIVPGYSINWYDGVSLSPDGKKLIINSGLHSHLLEIESNGSYTERNIEVPNVTYDRGRKGFVHGWRWAGNEILIGKAEINNSKGEFLENRIYVYHLEKRILRRLDISRVVSSNGEGIRILGVGHNLDKLRIEVGGANLIVEANLHEVSEVGGTAFQRDRVEREKGKDESQRNTVERPRTYAKTEIARNGRTSLGLYVLLVVFIIVTGVWVFARKRD